MAKIFFVEDDDDLRDDLTDVLKMHGHEVFSTDNKDEALKYLGDFDCALAILDVQLYEEQFAGLEICRQLKKKYPHIPVLFYSQYGDQRNLNIGLDMAEDYIVKNDDFETIRRKVDSILRMIRILKETDDVSEHKDHHQDFSLDWDAMEAKWKNQDLNLTAMEFEIVSLLSSKPNILKSRDTIIQSTSIGGYQDDVYNNSVDVHIKNIRAKFKKIAGENWNQIKNKRGCGWMWTSSNK